MSVIRFHPGETLVLNFVIPFSIYDVKAVAVSFRDANSVVFESLVDGIVKEDEYKTRVGFTMTQAESLQFKEKYKYTMQLNVFGPNSSRIASKEILVETKSQQLPLPGYSGITTFNSVPVTNKKGDGTITSYNDLVDKPLINSEVLVGNRILPETRITEEQINAIFTF